MLENYANAVPGQCQQERDSCRNQVVSQGKTEVLVLLSWSLTPRDAASRNCFIGKLLQNFSLFASMILPSQMLSPFSCNA
jgi:hypothetical protein